MPVKHLIIGTRPGESGLLRSLLRLNRDLCRFMREVTQEKETIVHVNPSLDFKALVRDGIFVLLSRLWGKKTLVFFRGWTLGYEQRIQNRWRSVFKSVFGRADAFIVLSSVFEDRLRGWIGDKPIYRESVILDDNDLLGFEIEKIIEERLKMPVRRLLFMARLIKEKGLYQAIDAVRILSDEGFAVELTIAGNGPEFESARHYATRHAPGLVHFAGYVRGNAKADLLRRCHLFFFPTRHGEGMPNAVIETMGVGLPVITRLEGGVADFFQHGVHGLATDSTDPRVYATLIRTVLEDRGAYRAMSVNAFNFAQGHFQASQAAQRLERIYHALRKTAGASPSAGRPVWRAL